MSVFLTGLRREPGRHTTEGVVERLRSDLRAAQKRLAEFVGVTKCRCLRGVHGDFWVRAPQPVPCPWCEVGKQLGRVNDAQATIIRLRGGDPLLCPAPASEAARAESAAEKTAPWDMSQLQADYEAEQQEQGGPMLLLPATDPDGEDTVTFPSPLVPPNPVVHVADADPEATQPVVTLAGRLPGSTDPVAVPALVRAGALAGLAAGGAA